MVNARAGVGSFFKFSLSELSNVLMAKDANPSISKTNLAFNYCVLKIQEQEQESRGIN